MTTIIAGHNLGLDDTSLRILNRQDSAGAGSLNQNSGQQVYVNASNGNLVIQEQDSLLTSRGQDFSLVRTYNSRGRMNSSVNGMSDWGWTWQTDIQLSTNLDTIGTTKVVGYEVAYGDGTAKYFDYDSTRKLWISTDGAGAFETLAKLTDNSFVLTRSDQSVIKFDNFMRLVSMADTNGVTMSFQYANATARKLTSITDGSGIVVTLNYKSLLINSVATDFLDTMSSTGGTVLVKYGWTNGLLTSVTDRYGHVTSYTYDSNKMLTGITLPASQTVNGQVQTYGARNVQFVYQTVSWKDTPHFKSAMDNGPMFILSDVIDPTGAKTSFEYGFTFAAAKHPSDRDVRYTYAATSFLTGGLTRVIDALGNARATSNDAEFVAWRQANGYYATYNATTVKASTTLTAQYNAIRYAQSVSYAYDADGYLTSVTDEAGFQTTYTYDTKDNLTSVVDRNGYGVTTSDSAYYRGLRKDLGYTDVSGNGKLAASLTAAEKTALLALYTTSYTWDANGNMLSMTDHGGNLTTWTWTSFNKVASKTAAMGNALATLDTPAIQQKRTDLGYPALLASLTAAQKTALQNLYTTTYAYDAKQNLISQTDPGGDLSKFEYDAYGNLNRRIVYTDKTDLVTASKQQITVYGYDAYGNTTSVTDAEGKTSTFQYDAFGNLLRAVDGRGGVSTYTYDASNRRLTSQDPEGNVTAYAWDAVGNMIAVTDAGGHTVTRIYDADNRLITLLDPSASSTAMNRSTQFRYDVLGNPSTPDNILSGPGLANDDNFARLLKAPDRPPVGAQNDLPPGYISNEDLLKGDNLDQALTGNDLPSSAPALQRSNSLADLPDNQIVSTADLAPSPSPSVSPAPSQAPAPRTVANNARLDQFDPSPEFNSVNFLNPTEKSIAPTRLTPKQWQADAAEAKLQLEEYFGKRNIQLETKRADLVAQLESERIRLVKERPPLYQKTPSLQAAQQHKVQEFVENVATYELSNSKAARKLLNAYDSLANADFAATRAGREAQLNAMDKLLGKVAADPKISEVSKQLVRNQQLLLREAVLDAEILASSHVRNPVHAVELKYLGLPPSQATAVGKFTDLNLSGPVKELGSGNFNTVYLAKYELPNDAGSFEGVFKSDAREVNRAVEIVPIGADLIGIDLSNPRFGNRNIATARLDELLQFDITTRSEAAIHNGQLGTISEKALGVSPKGSKVSIGKLSDDKVDLFAEAFKDASDPVTGRKIEGRTWLENYNANRDQGTWEIMEKTVTAPNGQQQVEYHFVKTDSNQVNYSDPTLRKELVRLQYIDAIAGQVDRHHGNYFVLQDANGRVLSVKGIDNDMSFGRNLRKVEGLDSNAVHLPDHLPRVIDKEAFDAINALTPEKLAQRLGPLLTRDEVEAAAVRLRLVQDHLKTVQAKGRVIDNISEWGSNAVGDLLTRQKKIDGQIVQQRGHTSYISRDIELAAHKNAEGLLRPYPLAKVQAQLDAFQQANTIVVN